MSSENHTVTSLEKIGISIGHLFQIGALVVSIAFVFADSDKKQAIASQRIDVIEKQVVQIQVERNVDQEKFDKKIEKIDVKLDKITDMLMERRPK